MHRKLLTMMLLTGLVSETQAQPAPDAPEVPVAPVPPEPPAAPEVAPAPPMAPVAPEVAPIAEPVAAAKPNAGYDKGFFLSSDDGAYKLKITGRFQPFVTLTRGVDPVDYKGAFEVRRMRLTFDGNVHGKRLTYKFQGDFGKGVPSVKDAHIDVDLADGVWLRAGQWKRPFSRQQINSSGKLEMTERSITDKAFGAGRDVGLALRNNYEKSPELEWTIGLFNGTGESPKLSGAVTVDPMTGAGTLGSTSNSNVPGKFKPALIGRIGLNRNGLKGYSEADLEGGPLRWGVGASVWLEGDFDDDAKSNQKLELDFLVKASGFSGSGGLYAMTEEQGGADPSVLDAETSLVGGHVQAGYMLNKCWQLAGRYGYVNDPRQKAKTSKDQQEVAAAVNMFSKHHDAKLQGGVRLIKTGDAGLADHVIFEIGANVGF